MTKHVATVSDDFLADGSNVKLTTKPAYVYFWDRDLKACLQVITETRRNFFASWMLKYIFVFRNMQCGKGLIFFLLDRVISFFGFTGFVWPFFLISAFLIVPTFFDFQFLSFIQ